MTCQEFFRANDGNRDYCKLLQEMPEEQVLAWELEQASEYSPGVVLDAEVLCRQVLDPQHFDAVNGTIKPTFFEDAAGKGASCHRLEYLSMEGIEALTRARVDEVNKNPPPSGPRVAIGVAKIEAGVARRIRSQNEPNRRAVAIFDTGKKVDVSHVDVCQVVKLGKQAGKSLRAQLFQAAKENFHRFNGL